jgi:hypothetical protein
MDRSRLHGEARRPDGVEIDLATLGAIADEHAGEVFGETIARGDPFPVVDEQGIVFAYVFPYAIEAGTFPSDELLHAQAAEGSGRFGAVYISARPMRHPVLGVVHGLHPALARGAEAERVGRSALAADEASLRRVYWMGLHEEYLEFETGGRSVLFDSDSLHQLDPETVLRRAPVTPGRSLAGELGPVRLVARTPIATGLTGVAVGPVLKLVPRPECVPVVDWTYWCVPTAFTMAICYHDNYVKGVGGTIGYGELAGYWFNHVPSGHNVPDFIDRIIDPTSGPPPTWRQGYNGVDDLIGHVFGYQFQLRTVGANAGNEWAWADITAEIDAGRPFVWGTNLPDGGHAVCALGYRVASDGSRRVVVNTTWGSTVAQQRDEWAPELGDGLTAIIPGGGNAGQDLVLWVPDGGETVMQNVATTITWHVWGDEIETAEVAESYDGGVTWSDVRQMAPCAAGWNTCEWTPRLPTERARVRIRGRDGAGRYIASDGSQSNVRVVPGPRQAHLDTYLVETTTDAQGFFSTPHGLERYTPDGAAIRGIVVSVQHQNGNWHTLEFSQVVDNRFWWNQQVVAGVIASSDFHERPVRVVVFAERTVG